jgi:hypothetical protein
MERDTSFARSAAAGAAAAGAATVVFHPADTVKTVLQHSARGAAADGAASTARALGVAGLYRGVLPAAFSMAPACAVRMGTYESVKGPLLRSDSALPPSARVALASGISVVASALVRSPLDMVKTQMQAAAGGSTGTSALGLLGEAWRDAGLAGVYRGVGLALMRDVPFFSINLALYEQLKATALRRRRRRGSRASSTPTVGDELSGGEVLLVGAVAQGVAGFCTNPIDVLKTRVQTSGGLRRVPLSVGEALRTVLKEGGARGLLRGAGMRVAWIGPQGCVYYPVYELAQQLLRE